MPNYYDEYNGDFGEQDTGAHIDYDEYLAQYNNDGGAAESAPVSASADADAKDISSGDTEFSKASDVDLKIGKASHSSSEEPSIEPAAPEGENQSKGFFGKIREGASNFAGKVKSSVKEAGDIMKGGVLGKGKQAVTAFASSTGMSVGAAAGVLGIGGGSVIALIIALLFGGQVHRGTAPANECEHLAEIFYQNSEYRPVTESQMKGAAQSIYGVFIKNEDGTPWMSAEAIMGLCSNAIGESHLRPECYEMDYMVGPRASGTDGVDHDMVLSRTHHVNWPEYGQRMFELYDESGMSLSYGTYYYVPIGRMRFRNGNTYSYEYEDEDGNTITVDLDNETLTLSYYEHLDIQSHMATSFPGSDKFGASSLPGGTYTYYDADGNIQTASYSGYYIPDGSYYPLIYPGVGLWQWTGSRAFELQRFADRDESPSDNNGDEHSDTMYQMYTQLAFLQVENYQGCFQDGSRHNGDGKLVEVSTYDYSTTHTTYDVLDTHTDSNSRTVYATQVTDDVIETTRDAYNTRANPVVDANTRREDAVRSYHWRNYRMQFNETLYNSTDPVFPQSYYDGYWHDGFNADGIGLLYNTIQDSYANGSGQGVHDSWSFHYFNRPFSVATADGYYSDGSSANPNATYNSVSEVLGDSSVEASYSGSNWSAIYGAAGSAWSQYLPEDAQDESNARFTHPYVNGDTVMVLPTDVIQAHEGWTDEELDRWISRYNDRMNAYYGYVEASYWADYYLGMSTALDQPIADAYAAWQAKEDEVAEKLRSEPRPVSVPAEPTPPDPPASTSPSDLQAWAAAMRAYNEAKALYDAAVAAANAYESEHAAWQAEYDALVAEATALKATYDALVAEQAYYNDRRSYMQTRAATFSAQVSTIDYELSQIENAIWTRVDNDAEIDGGGAVSVEYARWYAKYWEGCPANMFKTHLNNASTYYRYSVEERWDSGWTEQAHNSVMDLIANNVTDIHVYDMYASNYLQQCGGNDIDNSSIAALAVGWAYPRPLSGNGDGLARYCDINSSNRDRDNKLTQVNCTSLYIACVYIANRTEWTFASCDRGYAAACRCSGTDDSFPMGACTHQLEYCRNSPDWVLVTTLNSEADFALLEPGDLIVNDGHTITFTGEVGAELAMEKWPDLGYTMENCRYSICHSSRGDRGVRFDPDGTWVCSGNKYGVFYAFRCINPQGETSECYQRFQNNLGVLQGLHDGSTPTTPRDIYMNADDFGLAY